MNPAGLSRSAGLHQLARLYEIQTSYFNQQRQRIQPRPESLQAVLGVLGVPAQSEAQVAESIDGRLQELWHWRLEPVLALWDGQPGQVELRLPEDEAPNAILCRLTLESGESREWQLRLADGLPFRRVQLPLASSPQTCLELAIQLEKGLPHGYHTLEVEARGHLLRSLIIAAPLRAFSSDESSWGVFMPLHALHSQQNRDLASFDDLGRLARWSAHQGASFVGLLPLLPLFLDHPEQPSPYSAISRLFWNELYVSTAADGVAQATPAGDLVAYPEVMGLRRSVLERQLNSLSDRQLGEFHSYLQSRPEVDDYAQFRAAQERMGRNWHEWHLAARDGSLDAADFDPGAARYHAFAQWRATTDLQSTASIAREAGGSLYLDLPVGVNPDGFDPWHYRSLFVEGASVGAPPDLLAANGQDWGFQPLHPDEQRLSGYAYLRAYLNHHLSVASMLRIDHIMGLHRLYWVPWGFSARDGVYVRYHADEQYAIFSLESHRHRARIIGENLGTVPRAINLALARHNVGRMYVQRFEMRPHHWPLANPVQPDTIAALNTHDLPPFAAYWREFDIEQRLGLGLTTPEQAAFERHQRSIEKEALLVLLQEHSLQPDDPENVEAVYLGCLRLLAKSKAHEVLVSLEDLWQETECQNLPGTMDETHPNWRRRARLSLEQMMAHTFAETTFATLRQARPRETSYE